MRAIDRNSVSVPPPLQRKDLKLLAEKLASGEHKNPLGTVYAAEDVKSALKQLYLGKCYLCERSLGDKSKPEVEHFLPWHKEAADRAYDWKNLHWTCTDCNARKRQTVYKVRKGTKRNALVLKTKLVDPSDPPGPIEALWKWSREGEATATQAYEKDDVVLMTATFLNDDLPVRLRFQRYTSLMEVLATAAPIDMLQHLLAISQQTTEWHSTLSAAQRKGLRTAARVAEEYLSDAAEFGCSMRAMVDARLDVRARDFDALREVWDALP